MPRWWRKFKLVKGGKSFCNLKLTLVEFRRRPGPRSVMVSREELGYENMSEESGEESDPAAILKLPNGMRYRSTFFYNLMSWTKIAMKTVS